MAITLDDAKTISASTMIMMTISFCNALRVQRLT